MSQRPLFMDDSVRERYRNDVKYARAVDVLQHILESGMLTTYDLAQAAVLACQMYAERNMAPITVVLEDGRTAHLVRKTEP